MTGLLALLVALPLGAQTGGEPSDKDREWRVLTETPTAPEAPEKAPEGEFRLDPDLIQSVADAPEGLMREEPYVAHFRKGDLNLYYVSADHEGSPDGKTHKLIDRIFAKYPIKRVILEGRRYKDGDLSKEDAQRLIDGKKKAPYWSEGDQAIEHAFKRGIPSIGGEPSDKQVLEETAGAGFETRDLLAYYFTRMVRQYRADGRWEKDGPERLFGETMKYDRRELGLGDEPAFSYADFKAWHRERMDADFDPAKAEGEAAPDPRGTFLQRVGDAASNARNRFLAGVLSRELRARKHVLAVYGNGHHAAQRRALESALGKPLYEGDLAEPRPGD